MPAFDKSCYYCILFSVYYFVLSLNHYLSVSPAECFQDVGVLEELLLLYFVLSLLFCSQFKSLSVCISCCMFSGCRRMIKVVTTVFYSQFTILFSV